MRESSFFLNFIFCLGHYTCISQDIIRATTQLLWQNCIAGFQSKFQPWLHDTLGKGKEKHFSQSGLSLSLSLPDCFGAGPYSHWELSQSLFGEAVNSVSTTGCLQLRLCMFPHLSQRDRNLMYTAESIAWISGHVWNHRGWVRIHFKAFLKPWIMQSVHANLKQQLLWRH